ncbi:MAG: preprotein translocase subunit SecE [Clostridia bacterium]|nr:preprotein translocase subunit SecE [Clostridia bacterium]
MAENEKKTETQKAPKEKKPSVWSRIGKWFKSLKSECKKISWASWKSVRSNSIIVIVCIIIFSAVLALLDLGFHEAISGLSKIF